MNSRVYKKVSPNGKLVMYLERREIVIDSEDDEPVVRGVIVADPEYMENHCLYGQLALVFRYGREDEEVMGLTFCNVILLHNFKFHPEVSKECGTIAKSQLQGTIEQHLASCGVIHSFCFSVSKVSPPSVALYPAKGYTGSALGTSYDVHFYASKLGSDNPLRRSSVKMAVKMMQKQPLLTEVQPKGSTSKQFLMGGGQVRLDVLLQQDVFRQDEAVNFQVVVNNGCSKSVRKITAEVIQSVNVSMFKSGKFKSVVCHEETRDGCPLAMGGTITREFSLKPTIGAFKNWIALDDTPEHGGIPSASVHESNGDWTQFSVQVEYYVKVKLTMSGIGNNVCVHVPFVRIRERPDIEAHNMDTQDTKHDKGTQHDSDMHNGSDTNHDANKENNADSKPEQGAKPGAGTKNDAGKKHATIAPHDADMQQDVDMPQDVDMHQDADMQHDAVTECHTDRMHYNIALDTTFGTTGTQVGSGFSRDLTDRSWSTDGRKENFRMTSEEQDKLTLDAYGWRNSAFTNHRSLLSTPTMSAKISDV